MERVVRVSNVTALIIIFLAGCVSAPVTAQSANTPDDPPPSRRYVDPATLDPSIPTPASVIGHAIGDGAVQYDPMVRYLRALADASPLVTLTPYAVSHEGRKLFHLTITSKANHERLDRIKARNAKLADPRTLSSSSDAQGIIEDLPGIAWMAYSIHGDELSSTDAALQLAYQLAAGTDEATTALRDELVIHIDPLMNPDGRQRYLGQLQHLVGKVPNHDYQAMQHSGLWSAGRGNHYLFDLNRDWVPQVHPETRGRATKILEWNPHLVVDSHEMGPLDTYLFDPPRDPINPYISTSSLDWRRRVSADQAKAFDQHGWSYYTREWYEEWYPGYTNAWTGLLGAIGILYEQAGVNGAAIKQAAGNTLTYQEAVHHQLVSSLANLTTLRLNRREILSDYLNDRRWALSPEQSGTEVLLVPPPTDEAGLERFLDLLNRHGLEFKQSVNSIKADDVVDVWGKPSPVQILPAGTVVVRAAQPQRRLAQALLDFDPRMTEASLQKEREDLENRRGSRMYDVTAWNVCMAYGLEGYWAKGVTDIPRNGSRAEKVLPPQAQPTYGFLIDGASSDTPLATIRLLTRECKVRVAREPFAIGGHDYLPGTLLLRRHENPESLNERVAEATGDLTLDVRPVSTALSEEGPDLGGRRFGLLHTPRVAIASQWPMSSTSFGSNWYLLDARAGLRVSPINIQRLARMDLRKYNVLVLPAARGTSGLPAVLNESVCKKLKKWVDAGGTLIAMGGSAAYLANPDRGLSAVRLKRDVLSELPVYAEELKRERLAWEVKVDLDEVWGKPKTPQEESDPDPAAEDTEARKKSDKAKDLNELRREDDWLRMFRPRGAIVAAELRPDHWICAGIVSEAKNGKRLPVLLSSSFALMSKYPVRTPVRLADAHDLRLAGLLWPEARRRWSNSAYVTVERVGFGQVILFASDPFFRGYFESTGRLLLNAVVFGPGLGTSQPVPW